jgi:hypothetical protein
MVAVRKPQSVYAVLRVVLPVGLGVTRERGDRLPARHEADVDVKPGGRR